MILSKTLMILVVRRFPEKGYVFFFLCYYTVSCVLLRCNKSVGMIFKLSLNSNERKKAEGKKRDRGGGKKKYTSDLTYVP